MREEWYKEGMAGKKPELSNFFNGFIALKAQL
jgi:hypothetical protein